MTKEMQDDRFKPKCPPAPVDICVPVVFAVDDETGHNAFVDTNIFVFPSNICRVECENIEITGRTITFNCDRLLLCVDYILCLKFFPKVGSPYCQSFPGCFAKEIKFNEFTAAIHHRHRLTQKEFSEAQGVCVEVEVVPGHRGCFNRLFNLTKIDPCLTLIINFIRFNIRVKLFQERNIIVHAIVGKPAVRLPKVVESCCSCRFNNLINKKDITQPNDSGVLPAAVESALLPDIEKYKLKALEDFQRELQNETVF
ncbi:hypothetical protein [Desulforamulus hydrothermalis]|uniref:Uncharacterized protein n=1 Tax=Desulforamulus hydrothermalis Lam5 = DSM 18033 TaxID=1121428 RepID=K8DXK7_9FIRM|nr:hypothetical protein [Desulforamulus hydrothermalis]CCO07387.1 hypothetical protein DESHY_110331 [Desulforamulus hydrothermalis Lam5 = DSM 18033]SHH41408.1 hypothetical protein SAMN02745177_02472 [Desulforamulus hydrothermalis Lam5 = DSM 18033]